MGEAYRKPVPSMLRALKVNRVSLKLIHCHFIGSEWKDRWVDVMWSQLFSPMSSMRLHSAIAGSSRQPLAGSPTKRKLPLLILMLLLNLMGIFTAQMTAGSQPTLKQHKHKETSFNFRSIWLPVLSNQQELCVKVQTWLPAYCCIT